MRNILFRILHLLTLPLGLASISLSVWCGYGAAMLILEGMQAEERVGEMFFSFPVILRVVGILAGVILQFLLFRFKAFARNQFEFTEYGMNRRFSSYDRLSRKERDVIDRRKLEMKESILSSSTVRSMTHKGSANPEKELEELQGMENVKRDISRMAAMMSIGKKRVSTGMHMVFTGPPGTGKTTVAGIMTGFLYRYHFIRHNRFIECDGNFLKEGQYTALKTSYLIQEAVGGVLFIDEAYALMQGGTPDGMAAMATLIKEMEDKRGDFILILAGYDTEMEQLIQANPGFRSRISHYITFDTYDTDTLCEIYEKMASQFHYTVTEEAWEKIKKVLQWKRMDLFFGNAREVRNLVERNIGNHLLRISQKETQRKNCIEPEDIERLEAYVTVPYPAIDKEVGYGEEMLNR